MSHEVEKSVGAEGFGVWGSGLSFGLLVITIFRRKSHMSSLQCEGTWNPMKSLQYAE